MEIATTRTHRPNRQTSSFDCDGATFDGILGMRTLGERNLRFDAGGMTPDSNKETNIDHPIDAQSPLLALEISPEYRHERMIRLLEQQQRIHEAELEARCLAERLLQLIDHQQQIAISVCKQIGS